MKQPLKLMRLPRSRNFDANSVNYHTRISAEKTAGHQAKLDEMETDENLLTDEQAKEIGSGIIKLEEGCSPFYNSTKRTLLLSLLAFYIFHT